ncbi:MAG: hypothetical protein JNM27_09665 [Leptospirales bacterium]|nr:hypothetical protein [Leptospirales bacterium]
MENTPVLENATPARPPFVGWCIAAVLMALGASLIGTISELLKSSGGPFVYSHLTGYFMGGFLCPAIFASLFMIRSKWRNLRTFFKVSFWVSAVALLANLANLAKGVEPTLYPINGPTYSIQLPCPTPEKESKPSGFAQSDSQFCNLRGGRIHVRFSITGPGAVDSGQFDQAAQYMITQMMKEGKVTSTSQAPIADTIAHDFFFTGLIEGKTQAEGRYRTFISQGYLYQFIFLSADKGTVNQPWVKAVFESFTPPKPQGSNQAK